MAPSHPFLFPSLLIYKTSTDFLINKHTDKDRSMKLLGWMHRRLWQNTGDPFSDFKTRNPCNCVSDQWTLYADEDRDRDAEDPPMIYIGEDDSIFHGLLNIGTLGSPITAFGLDVVNDAQNGEATPTFAAPPPSVDYYVMGKDESSEATKLDLMVLNSALEKALAVTGPKPKILTARTAGNVGAKHLVVESNNNISSKSNISSCPLHDYILGSSLEMSKTWTVDQKEKHRRTLMELFMDSDLEEKGRGGGGGNNNKKKVKSTAAGVQSLVKKILKCHGSRRHSSGGSEGSTGDGDILDDHGGTPPKMLHKMMQMFHKKIHPDQNQGTAKKLAVKSEKGIVTKLLKTDPKNPSLSYCFSAPATSSDAPHENSTESNGSRERWIKTDSEYLVLEL